MLVNNGARETKCGSFDGGDDGELAGLGLVMISGILAMLVRYLDGAMPYD